jgi:hypothetical protein
LARNDTVGQVAADLNSRPQNISDEQGHEQDRDQSRKHAESRNDQGCKSYKAGSAQNGFACIGQAQTYRVAGILPAIRGRDALNT